MPVVGQHVHGFGEWPPGRVCNNKTYGSDVGEDLTRGRTNALKNVSRPLPLAIVDARQLRRRCGDIERAEHGGGPAREQTVMTVTTRQTRGRRGGGKLCECPSSEQHGDGGQLRRVSLGLPLPAVKWTPRSKDPIRVRLQPPLHHMHQSQQLFTTVLILHMNIGIPKKKKSGKR